MEREVLKNTKSECMRETGTLSSIAAFKLLKTDILSLVIVIIMEIVTEFTLILKIFICNFVHMQKE